MATLVISEYTCNPTQELSTDDILEVRSFYTSSFIASDGVTPVFSNNSNGAFGPYYSLTPTLNGSGFLVVPAHSVQPTTESNPTALYIEQLWVNGAFSQTLMPNTAGATGWQIPTVYGDPIAYDEIATYNRARRLLYAPQTYFTANETTEEIRRLSGNFDYMAVGVNGIGRASFPPVVTNAPVVLMENDPRVGDWANISAYFASTTATAAQNATFIAAAVSAASSAGKGIYIPAGTFATNSVTISVPIAFAPSASILAPATGQTVTITKSVTADASKHFGGLGSISFGGNNSVTEVWGAWWGALPSATATVNTAALNAASAALVPLASGNILLGPGTYLTNDTVIIGSTTVGVFTGIGLRGDNGEVGTRITFSGSGDAIKVVNCVYSRVTDICLINGGSKGSTRGIVFCSTGGGGASSFYCELQRVFVNNFHIGVENGNTASGLDADLIDYKHCALLGNDIGLKITGSNSTMVHTFNVSVNRNATYGVQLALAGGSQINWYGGSFGGNAISFYNNGTNTMLNIQGIRDEYLNLAGGVNPNYQFILNEQSASTIKVSNYLIIGDGVSVMTNPAISNNGGLVHIEDSQFGVLADHIVPFGPSSGGAQVGMTTLTMTGCTVNANVSLFTSNSNMVGMTYRLLGNKSQSDVGVYGDWPDEIGVIDNVGAGARNSVSRFTPAGALLSVRNDQKSLSLVSYQSVTPAQITSNQDNYNPGAIVATLRLATDASRNITGLTFSTTQTNGQTCRIVNVGSFNIVLKNETTSTAANRFLNSTAADITLSANQAADLEYDSVVSRWRVFKRT